MGKIKVFPTPDCRGGLHLHECEDLAASLDEAALSRSE